MAALQAALEAQPHRHAGDLDQRLGAGVAAFVDMEVEIEVAVHGQLEEMLEQVEEVRRQGVVLAAAQARDATQNAAGPGDDVGEPFALGLGEGIHWHDAGGLDLDPSGPRIAHRHERRPGYLALGGVRIEVRAHRDRPLGIGALQAELHALAHVLLGPSRRPIARGRTGGAQEAAVRVGRARPDVALVEMGVDVDEARPDQAAAQRRRLCRSAADRRQPGDPPVADLEIQSHQSLEVGRAGQVTVDQAALRAGIGQPVMRPVGHGGEADALHVSSCSFGPRASRSLMNLRERDARGPEEEEDESDGDLHSLPLSSPGAWRSRASAAAAGGRRGSARGRSRCRSSTP